MTPNKSLQQPDGRFFFIATPIIRRAFGSDGRTTRCVALKSLINHPGSATVIDCRSMQSLQAHFWPCRTWMSPNILDTYKWAPNFRHDVDYAGTCGFKAGRRLNDLCPGRLNGRPARGQ